MRTILRLVFLLLTIQYASVFSNPACKAGTKPVHFVISPYLEQNLPKDFRDNLYSELSSSFLEIGFCFQPLSSTSLTDTSKREDILMFMTQETMLDTFNSGRIIIVSILRIDDWVKGNTNVSIEHPLISISYQAEELSTFRAVLVKKIIENIRTQYVCHLRIQSNPNNILITTSSGLESRTPLEWIIPVGSLVIKNKTDGYENFQKKLSLDEPGIHTYFLELKKKQFYHSKFLIPTIGFVLSSAICYYGERHYYSRYMSYGKEEALNNPDLFNKTFSTAKLYETAKYASLALCGVSFTFSFIVN